MTDSSGPRWTRGVIVLLAGAAVVAIGSVVAALAALAALHHIYFDRGNLPDLGPLTQFEFPTIGHIYDTNGQALIELAREHRQITQYGDIPPIVRDAILAAEDRRFFSHNGVDYFPTGKFTVGNAFTLARSGVTFDVVPVWAWVPEYRKSHDLRVPQVREK